MKSFFSGCVFIFFTFFFNLAVSNDSIYFIDLEFIMNNSVAGKSIIKQLEQKNKLNLKIFEKTESSLKDEENKLIAQKNIIEKIEFEKKINQFKKKVSDYREKRSIASSNFLKQKDKAQQNLINKLSPILDDYSKNNAISFILPKQSIILGKTELDLTKEIIIILNKKIKTIKLK